MAYFSSSHNTIANNYNTSVAPLMIFENNNLNNTITGGFSLRNWGGGQYDEYRSERVAHSIGGSINLSADVRNSSGGCSNAILYTNNKIDLSPYTKIIMEGDFQFFSNNTNPYNAIAGAVLWRGQGDITFGTVYPDYTYTEYEFQEGFVNNTISSTLITIHRIEGTIDHTKPLYTNLGIGLGGSDSLVSLSCDKLWLE